MSIDTAFLVSELEKICDAYIFHRGLAYNREGNVKSWKIEKSKDSDAIKVIGQVQGSELYSTSIYVKDDGKKFNVSCDCPYGGLCKHVVALAVALNYTLGTSPTQSLQQPLQPDWIIPNALDSQNQKNKIDASKMPRNSFNPKEYFITLEQYRAYAPEFHKKDNPFQQASVARILKRKDLSEPQRKLLEYIRTGRSNYYTSSTTDLGVLFPLIVESGFVVHDSIYSSDSRKISIDLNPPRLKAELVYEPFDNPYMKTITHNFYVRIPEEYWQNDRGWRDDIRLIHSGSCVVRDVGGTLELYRLTPLLAGVISRIHLRSHRVGVDKYKDVCQTSLTGEEVMRWDELINDMKQHLDPSSPLSDLKIRICDIGQPTIAVNFDVAAHSIKVQSVIDYGTHLQDVSESVYESRRKRGRELMRRQPYGHTETHAVVVKDGEIWCAAFAPDKEIELYREFSGQIDESSQTNRLGFTKTLKCSKDGAAKVNSYISDFWPKLLEYAESKGYPILFEKDRVEFTEQSFRAEFSADLNIDNDWLYFDVNCYCGNNRVTLEKLYEFIENGEQFWRSDDGKLIKIKNRTDLERLVRLLKSFHAKQKGFEGSVRQAAELEYVMTSSTYYEAERAKSFKKFMLFMDKGKPIKPVRLPASFNSVMRPYQKSGVEWLYFLRSYRFGGILADDMGLGKTLQALAIMTMERRSKIPSLVVCPKTLVHNWKAEAKKFSPDLDVLIYEGSPGERAFLRRKFRKYDIIVASYGIIRRDEDFFTAPKTRFNYVVLDEAQFVKNHAAKNAQTIKKLNADYRLALTGTPLENNVFEIWSIFDFLMPGFLGKKEHFQKHFHNPIMSGGDAHALEHLRRKVKHFMLRRVKGEVLTELPPKIEQTSECQLTDDQNILYQQVLHQVRAEVFSAVKKRGFASSQIHILAGLTKLRQVCNHPALLTDGKKWHEQESAKLDMCLELIEEVRESGRKVLVFSQFTSMLDILSEALDDMKIGYAYLSGKTRDRQAVIESFNTDEKITVFLISMKAGGTGLNLTSADTVIVYDPWWNPSVENQAVDRAHRIGQTRTVNVYRLIAKGTIEEKIQTLKAKKRRIFEAVIGESGESFKKLTWNDVRELFVE